MKGTHWCAGVVGALTIIVILVLVLIIAKCHNFVPIQIVNTEIDLSESIEKIKEVKELKELGVILSPTEYTNNLSSYYNTFLTVIIALFALFSFFTYSVSKKNVQEQVRELVKNELVEMMKDSKEFEKSVLESLYGRFSEEYASLESLQALKDDIDALKHDLSESDESEGSSIIA